MITLGVVMSLPLALGAIMLMLIGYAIGDEVYARKHERTHEKQWAGFKDFEDYD